jgi:precorrin-6B methylase 2
MKSSTGGSRVALHSAPPRRGRAARSQPWTAEKLRNTGSYWRARILSTAVGLELFDWLGKGAKGSRDASGRFGGSREAWEIFLDALSALGLLRKRKRRYQNTLFARRYLCSGKAGFLLPDHDAWDLWGGLPELLTKTSRPRIPQPFLTDRKRAERLLRSLDRDARKIAPFLVARLSLRNAQTLLDVGGGLGTFALACCRRFERLRATVVEHPRVVSLARRAVKNARMAKRVRVISRDIVKEPLPPGFDRVLISNVLHGQGVRENRALLESAYRSLNSGGRIIVRDVFMNRARTDPEWGALFSVSILLHTPNGRCYALDEVRDWLRQAGFSTIRGPFRSSPLSFDPDAILIAVKSK